MLLVQQGFHRSGTLYCVPFFTFQLTVQQAPLQSLLQKLLIKLFDINQSIIKFMSCALCCSAGGAESHLSVDSDFMARRNNKAAGHRCKFTVPAIIVFHTIIGIVRTYLSRDVVNVMSIVF
jgi:hypothetical protein